MPRLTRRPPTRRAEGLTPGQRRHLFSGTVRNSNNEHFRDKATFLETWEEFKDDLLPEFIKKHPGRRPMAWYLAEGRERPFTDTIPEFWIRALRGADGWRNTFGLAHTVCGDPEYQYQQRESDYLAEHGLLIRGEALAISKAKPLPYDFSDYGAEDSECHD